MVTNELTKTPLTGWGAVCLLLWLCFPAMLTAQERQRLESQRHLLQQDIEQTDELLQQTAKNKALAYERYQAVKAKIRKREKLVKTIQAEVGYHDGRIQRSADVIASLEGDIAKIGENYAELLRLAYRRKVMKSDLLFLVSASSFNEAFKRWRYLKQYDRYRQNQARRIIQTQESLGGKIKRLEERRKEKERLLAAERLQLKQMNKEFATKDMLLAELRQNEQQLKEDIANKKQEHDAINQEIERLLQQGIVGNRPRRFRHKSAAFGSGYAPSPSKAEDAAPTAAFAKKRGKLPWPVKNGVVTSRFGEQAHPTIPNSTISNSGVDIISTSGEVRPVAEGEVRAVRFVAGYDYLVLIKHGEYYTLYSKLERHSVKKGMRVSPDKPIGKLRKANNGKLELHFEVWRNERRLNPADWLRSP